MADENSIWALIKLMDDPDEEIFSHVRDRLLQYGPDAIPFLETSWETHDFGLAFQSRVENLIHEIQFEVIKKELIEWRDAHEKDLLAGALLVAKYQFPGLHEEKVYDEIKRIEKDVWLEINSRQTALEKVKILNKVLFELHHYHGDSKHFHSPMNSYINTVLESKKGNPLSLSIVYSIVAQNLNIPIYGVNLPNHFILAYMDEFGVRKFLSEENNHGVLFYINPFSKGTVFDEVEIKNFLNSINKPHLKEYFEPCSNTQIIRRMLTNLIASFQEVGNSEKVRELIELRELFEN